MGKTACSGKNLVLLSTQGFANWKGTNSPSEENTPGPWLLMLSVSVIIFFSVVLFAYWFRYSCLLILQNRAASSPAYALSSGLTFPVVQQRLKTEGASVDVLDQLRLDLSNDYRILCFLLRCSADAGVDPIERRMLMMDYWIMQAW